MIWKLGLTKNRAKPHHARHGKEPGDRLPAITKVGLEPMAVSVTDAQSTRAPLVSYGASF